MKMPRLSRLRRSDLSPVLAEAAGEVAAGGTERKHQRARQEMVERLLLHWVDADAAGASVRREEDPVPGAGADEAQPVLPLAQPADAGAHIAVHPPAVETMP